jgi:hypothetical protein
MNKSIMVLVAKKIDEAKLLSDVVRGVSIQQCL